MAQAKTVGEEIKRDDAAEIIRAGRFPPAAAPTPKQKKRKLRSWWLKQLHTWHWVSAAISLAAMLLFAVTGITLNHASSIAAIPKVSHAGTTLPPPLLAMLKTHSAADAPLPPAVAAHLAPLVNLDAAGKPAEWSDSDVYVALPRPGGDAWISIDRSSGVVTSEITTRGWVSYLNDLHKGRNTGSAWFWFIDVFAGACILFTLTGLLLLQFHAKNRPSTWPLVGLSIALPVIIALIFIH